MFFRALPFALVVTSLLSAASSSPAASAKVYRDFAAKRDGDAARGRAIFFAQDKAGCAQCHAIDGTTRKAGPDLLAIGHKFPRRELVDAILDPNATIAVGYEATLVETKSGETFYGVVKEANATRLELIGGDGNVMRIAASDVKSKRPSAVSLMPENLHGALTVQEFTDLIEFLVTLKEPDAAGTAGRGIPNEIPVLAKPITLRPFFEEKMRFPHSPVRRLGEPRSGLVWFGELPGQPGHFLGVHQSGKIWRLEKNTAGDVKSLFADLYAEVFAETGPNGLLGVAFHPQFRENRKYYLKHQVWEGSQICTTLVERRVTTDFLRDSGEPSRRLLSIPCITPNHTGGTIEFGPDGFLYLGMGDTGPQEDPNGHGQDMQLLLGKMLRIDVDARDAGLPYAIPADNPFRGRADARPEIWAVGFREPWRFSFDSVTGDLWVGDVGQNRLEEVAIVRRGENHGWNVYEGFEAFSNRRRREGESYVPPVFTYKRKYGNSVTGGYVYRGDPRSSFHGVYIFGDYTSKLIFGVTQENRVLKSVRQIGTSPESIVSFATDARGNIYVVNYEGMVYVIDFSAAEFEHAPAKVAAVTSGTGLPTRVPQTTRVGRPVPLELQ